METDFFKIPPKEIQKLVIDRVLDRIETRYSSFTREDVINFAKETKIPATYTDIKLSTIEDLGVRIFSRLLVNKMIIPVKGTKYYKKITQEEINIIEKAYLESKKGDNIDETEHK